MPGRGIQLETVAEVVVIDTRLELTFIERIAKTVELLKRGREREKEIKILYSHMCTYKGGKRERLE